MWTVNVFLVYEMIYDWNMHEKLRSSYSMENSKVFTIVKYFFYCHKKFLLTHHRYKRNRNDFFVGKDERNFA